jgi:hypothetical protein
VGVGKTAAAGGAAAADAASARRQSGSIVGRVVEVAGVVWVVGRRGRTAHEDLVWRAFEQEELNWTTSLVRKAWRVCAVAMPTMTSFASGSVE